MLIKIPTVSRKVTNHPQNHRKEQMLKIARIFYKSDIMKEDRSYESIVTVLTQGKEKFRFSESRRKGLLCVWHWPRASSEQR